MTGACFTMKYGNSISRCDVARLELLLHGVENVGDVLDVDHVAVRVEHLEEAAHVGAFEFLGQIHEHADGRNRVLHRARLVPHLDREAQTPHADLVDAQFPVIALALLVVQFDQGRRHRVPAFQAALGRPVAQGKRSATRVRLAPHQAATRAG